MSWFVDAFGSWYHIVYAHRSDAEAEQLLATLARLRPLEGARWLDVGCGPGRHLRQIARAGAEPTGLDLSPELLAEARRVRGDDGGVWPLVRGDMRSLPFRGGHFDVATSLFTSFGYFPDEADDLRALREAARVLRPGGVHVLDFLNRDAVLAHPKPEGIRESGGYWIHERRRIEDGRRVVKDVAVRAEPEGDALAEYQERVTLYEEGELRRLLAAAGLAVREVFGGYDGAPWDPRSSSRLILLSERESE